jgi:hypothetical protein
MVSIQYTKYTLKNCQFGYNSFLFLIANVILRKKKAEIIKGHKFLSTYQIFTNYAHFYQHLTLL